MKLSEVKPYLAFNGLFKGDPGTGKTPAALSFPTPILFFDTDYRANSLTTFFKNDRERLKSIEVIQPTHFDQVKTELSTIWEKRYCPFATIVLDTLSTYSKLSIRGAMEVKTGGTSGRKVGSVLIPGIQDYGDEATILDETMTLLRLIYLKLHVNTILVAHVITTEEKDIGAKDKAKSVIYSRSLLTAGKKIAALLPAYFDEVYHFEVRPSYGDSGKPEFTAKVRHTGFDFARTGLDLPDEIEFTNYDRIPDRFFYEKIKPYLTKSQEEYETAMREEDTIERQEKITIDESATQTY